MQKNIRIFIHGDLRRLISSSGELPVKSKTFAASQPNDGNAENAGWKLDVNSH
jgi:hypothetical protein